MPVSADVLPYVPVAALVVAILAYLATRRDGRTKTAERHEAAGPQVEVLRGSLSGQTVKVWLQVVGGPPTTDVTIRSGGSTCTGIAGQRDHHSLGLGSRVEQPGTHPLERIEVYAHLSVEPRRDHGQVLPVIVDVEAPDDRPRRWWRRSRPRRWTRNVSVPITFPPQIY